MNNKLNQKYLKYMKEILDEEDGDTEANHYVADNLLCSLLEELGYKKLVKVYKDIDKWYA